MIDGVIGTCKLNIEEETQLLEHCQYLIDLPRVYNSKGNPLPQSYILTLLADESESYLINTEIGLTYQIQFHRECLKTDSPATRLNPDVTLQKLSVDSEFPGGFGCTAPQPILAHEPKIDQQQIWIFGGNSVTCITLLVRIEAQRRQQHNASVDYVQRLQQPVRVHRQAHLTRTTSQRSLATLLLNSMKQQLSSTVVYRGSTWCFDLHNNYWTKLTHQPIC